MGKSVEEIRAEMAEEDAAKAGNTITDVNTGLSQKAKPKSELKMSARPAKGTDDWNLAVQNEHDRRLNAALDAIKAAREASATVENPQGPELHIDIQRGLPAVGSYRQFLSRHPEMIADERIAGVDLGIAGDYSRRMVRSTMPSSEPTELEYWQRERAQQRAEKKGEVITHERSPQESQKLIKKP